MGEYTVTIGDLHENGLSCEFAIFSGGDDTPDIHGSVKWDGCINWQTTEDCMAHFCSPENADELSRAFKEAWVGCANKMGDNYDDFAPRPEL